MKKYLILLTLIALILSASGCALNFYQGKPDDQKKIQNLSVELNELKEAKKLLAERLAKEIKAKEVLLELADRGLVITLSNEILFDSGKAKLKGSSEPVLNKISSVILEKVPEGNIGVEGHADNVPIKHSGWKSNWELSTARATSVVHYLIDECGIKPKNLSAIGYGQYRPIDTNETKVGRSKNRRVEIVILPSSITKKSYEEAQNTISEEARLKEEAKVK